MSENSSTQPPRKPQPAPKVRVIQENVVPQSGSAAFMFRYASAMKNMGMKETMMIAGMWLPTPPIATMKPIVAARL